MNKCVLEMQSVLGRLKALEGKVGSATSQTSTAAQKQEEDDDDFDLFGDDDDEEEVKAIKEPTKQSTKKESEFQIMTNEIFTS